MAATNPEAVPRVRPVREVISDLGGAVALGAVLLPVAGVVVRDISFLVAQTVNYPLALALAASPAELVATGFGSLVFGLAVLPAIPFLGDLGRLQHHHETSQQFAKRFDAFKKQYEAVDKAAEIPKELIDELGSLEVESDRLLTERKRLPQPLPDLPRVFHPISNAMGRHKRIVRTLGGIYWAGLILLGPWPITLSTVGIVLALVAVPQIARRTGRVALSQVWPVVVAVLLIAAVGAGFDGTYVVGAEAGDYHFANDVRLMDGRYVRLGETSGQTILMACGQPKPSVTTVTDSQIITVGIEPWKGPLDWQNLFGILMGHARTYGFQIPC